MLTIKDLSAFQRNLNSLTLYLYLMNTRCKHLKDYDDEGDFKSHNYFFFLCRTKLKDKIEDDENLLINHPIFNNYDFNFENDKKSSKKNKFKIKFIKEKLKNIKFLIEKFKKDIDTKKEKKEFIYKTYFEYSKTLSKRQFRNKAYKFCTWGGVGIFMIILILSPLLSFNILNKYTFKELIELYSIFLCVIMISAYYLIYGIILFFEIRNKKMNKTKFHFMYSDDYCYKRIKECEFFFRMNYKVENEFLELSEIERQFPELDNLFYNTIQTTKMTETNKQKLLKINEHVYCRAVFSELFKSIKEDGIEQLQQIPFVFKTCKQKANVIIPGNTGFVECVNHLLGEEKFFDTTFNQAMPKLSNPENDIIPKYLKILKKYENILQ